MADDPKKESEATEEETPSSAALSPAPTVVSGKPKEDAGQPSSPSPEVQAEPLADGTVPTVLTPGQTHRKVAKGKASITNIYRKADITTTIFTFVGAIVFAAIALGIYAFLNRGQGVKAPETKVTKLDTEELKKLETFFNGNSAGTPSQILTVSASSLFKQRVALSSDLKVVGNAEFAGTTALSSLTVEKTSTLGVTDIRGQLGVSGPTTLRGPAIMSAGATITGSLGVSGNGTYGGSVSAGTLNTRDLSVSGTLNLNGHFNIGGQNATASAASGSVFSPSVVGTDAAGTVSFSMNPTAGSPGGTALVTVNFRQAYPRAPTVIISSNSRQAATLMPWVQKTATSFTIMASSVPASGNAQSFSFDYFVIQ